MTDGSSRPVLDRDYDGSVTTLATARADLGDALDELGIEPSDIEKIVLAANEMTTNAVNASPGRRYRLSAAADSDGAVVITVRNQQPVTAVPDRDEWGPSKPLASGGRGLSIVDHLADSVSIEQGEGDWIAVTARLSTERPDD